MNRKHKILIKFILFSTIIFISDLWSAEGINNNSFTNKAENYSLINLTINENEVEKYNLSYAREINSNQFPSNVFINNLRCFEKSILTFDDFDMVDQKLGFQSLFTPRRITGFAYSFFVPGSGQIYLGHKTKGMIFAVSFFTGLVGAIVSQNNFIGNRERIQSLQFEYLNADRFTLADYYWKQMISVHDEQKLHERARNIFTVATILVWSFNLVDYIFLSDDKGPVEFSSIQQTSHNDYNLVSISIPLR